MKKSLSSTVTVTLLLLLILASSALHGSPRKPLAGASGSDFSDLTLRVTSTKEEFVQLEPIPIVLSVSNETKEPIIGHSALSFASNFVKLLVTNDVGETYQISNLSPLTSGTFAAPRAINPGEKLEVQEVLAFQLDKNFSRPGKYRLQAVLYDGKRQREIKSNAIEIQILAPEGASLEALKYIQKLGAASYFFSGAGFPSREKARAALEQFAVRYTTTAYADYAAYLLGELYFYDEDYQRAQDQFGKVVNKSNSVLSDKSATYLDKIRNEGNIPPKD
jgi:hypothetical protein